MVPKKYSECIFFGNVSDQKFAIPSQQLMGLDQEASPSLQSAAITCVGKKGGPIQY